MSQIKAMLGGMSFNGIDLQSFDLKRIARFKRGEKAVPQALARLAADAFDIRLKNVKSLDDFRQCISLHITSLFRGTLCMLRIQQKLLPRLF